MIFGGSVLGNTAFADILVFPAQRDSGGINKGRGQKGKEIEDFLVSDSILYSEQVEGQEAKQSASEITRQLDQALRGDLAKDKEAITSFKAKRKTIDQILNGPMAGMPLDEKSRQSIERTLKGQGFDSEEIWFLMEELL